jgi:hypothetical protein
MAYNKNIRMVPVKAKPKPTKPTNAQIAAAAIRKAVATKPKPKRPVGPTIKQGMPKKPGMKMSPRPLLKRKSSNIGKRMY